MMYSVYDLRDKVKEIVHSIFDIYDIKEFRECNARCTICDGGVIRFNGTYKIFAVLDACPNFINPLDGFVTVTFDVVDNEVANIGVTTTFLPDIASCFMAEEIKGRLNEWLKEAAKPKIWVGSAPVDPEIKEKFVKFMKDEQKAILDAYIPDTIKRYIENDPVIMSKNYISEEEKNMIEGKKCINRADVYKTMTDDQKIVMQDTIANAIESAIKDCRMEYEKTIKAQQLQIENYKGLINNIYGKNGVLSKIDQLKDSLEVQKIIINEPAMIVFWKDGTKTVVTATDEAFDEEKGLAMAFAKKALGNNYAAGGRFKAKLKHAERVNRKEETVENDISKTPICKEIMDEAIRRVKAEADDAQKEKPTSGRYPWGEDKRLKKSEFVKQMLDAGFTKDEADSMWKGYKER